MEGFLRDGEDQSSRGPVAEAPQSGEGWSLTRTELGPEKGLVVLFR